MYKVALVWGMLVLSGCQVMNEADCQSADWRSLGQRDGAQGSTSRLGSRIQACQKFNVIVPKTDMDRYNEAYRVANTRYCQVENIYRLALVGQGRVDACMGSNYGQLKAIYDTGSGLYNTKREVKNLEYRMREIERKLETTSDKEERYKLLEEQRSKQKELSSLKADTLQFQQQLNRLYPQKSAW